MKDLKENEQYLPPGERSGPPRSVDRPRFGLQKRSNRSCIELPPSTRVALLETGPNFGGRATFAFLSNPNLEPTLINNL